MLFRDLAALLRTSLGDLRDEVLRWPNREKKRRALLWLDVYSRWGYENQQELFVRRDEIAPGLQELFTTT